jgi:hypothetical protein
MKLTMEIQYRNRHTLQPYAHNPRRNDHAVPSPGGIGNARRVSLWLAAQPSGTGVLLPPLRRAWDPKLLARYAFDTDNYPRNASQLVNQVAILKLMKHGQRQSETSKTRVNDDEWL